MLLNKNMKKILFIFLLLCSFSILTAQSFLKNDYSFLESDGVIKNFHKSNDTLYYMTCFANYKCLSTPESHYKIIETTKKGKKYLLKLEQLDTLKNSKDKFPKTRFSVMYFNELDSNRMSMVQHVGKMTREEISKKILDTFNLVNKFPITIYNRKYLEKLSDTYKPIKTKDDVMEIMTIKDSKKFTALKELYKKANIVDKGGGTFTAEILTIGCIDKGFNPVSAGRFINEIMRVEKK